VQQFAAPSALETLHALDNDGRSPISGEHMSSCTARVITIVCLVGAVRLASANPNCKEDTRPGPDLPIVATKIATDTDPGTIRVGIGGPVFVRVVNKGPTAAIQMFVRKPGASLLRAICDNVAILQEDGEFWMQVYFVGDDLPDRDIDVLTGEKHAKLEVSVFKGASVLPTTVKDRVTIRMRAFIPNAIRANPSYVRKVLGSANAWMIPGPIAQATQALHLDLSGDCFLSDNRTFDTAKNASSRVRTEFDIVVYYGQVSIEPVSDGGVHRAGESTRLACADGKVIEKKWGQLGIRALGKPSIASGQIQIAGQVSGSNPHFTIAPSIDYSFDVIYDTATHKLTFKLTAGTFPAFEAYAVRGGKTVTLTNQEPESETVWGLVDGGLGLHMKQISGSVQL
jgi:hypothetical protein